MAIASEKGIPNENGRKSVIWLALHLSCTYQPVNSVSSEVNWSPEKQLETACETKPLCLWSAFRLVARHHETQFERAIYLARQGGNGWWMVTHNHESVCLLGKQTGWESPLALSDIVPDDQLCHSAGGKKNCHVDWKTIGFIKLFWKVFKLEEAFKRANYWVNLLLWCKKSCQWNAKQTSPTWLV